jgi:peroxiredoxin
LHSLLPKNRKGSTAIVAISPDPPARIGMMIPKVQNVTNKEFVVTLLSDADHGVTDHYGLRNPEAVKRGWYVPHPTTYVIDRQGIVRWKLTEKDYRIRPTNAQILEELRKLL